MNIGVAAKVGQRVQPSGVRRLRREGYTDDMSTDLLDEARRLSPRDRLQLIEALWDTLSEEDLPVTAEERALLDARAADMESNPDDQSPWSEVKTRLEQRRR